MTDLPQKWIDGAEYRDAEFIIGQVMNQIESPGTGVDGPCFQGRAGEVINKATHETLLQIVVMKTQRHKDAEAQGRAIKATLYSPSGPANKISLNLPGRNKMLPIFRRRVRCLRRFGLARLYL